LRFFPRHKKEAESDDLLKDLGPLLVQVSAHECNTFQGLWKRHLDDKTQVALFAEIAIILIAFVDRLVFDKFGDPKRSQMMNPLVDTIRESFSNQSHFGQTREERGLYFERLFADRMQKFASCSSIGEGQSSLVFTGGCHLAEIFVDNTAKIDFPVIVLETSKSLGKTILALMMIPEFKIFNKK